LIRAWVVERADTLIRGSSSLRARAGSTVTVLRSLRRTMPAEEVTGTMLR
jgi:hypothetical protein